MPPLLAALSTSDISESVSHRIKPTLHLNLADIPGHTQAVEHCEKLVANDFSTKVYGHERRDGLI